MWSSGQAVTGSAAAPSPSFSLTCGCGFCSQDFSLNSTRVVVSCQLSRRGIPKEITQETIVGH